MGMSELSKLNLPVNIASGSLGAVIRDAFRNTTSKKRVLICAADTTGGTAVSAISTTIAAADEFRILSLTGTITDEDKFSVTKSGTRYEVKDSAANNLAPIFYADANRTTFPNFFDAMVACLVNSEVLNEAEDTIGDTVGILIDQTDATPYAAVVDAAVGNAATVGSTILMQFKPDAATSSDFGE